jgi:hypothetical protein
MNSYKINFYELRQKEIEKAQFRENFLSRNKNAHVSNYYQTLNLDKREPSYSKIITGDISKFNLESIDNKVFAIDITSENNELITRYLRIPKENLSIQDKYNNTYKLSTHVSIFMLNTEKIKHL